MFKPGRIEVDVDAELVEGNNAKQISTCIKQAFERAFLMQMLRHSGTYFRQRHLQGTLDEPG